MSAPITAREATERILAAGLESLEEYGKDPRDTGPLMSGLAAAARLLWEMEQAEERDQSR